MDHVAASGWSPGASLAPCIAVSSAFGYGLYILSAPRHYRLDNLAIVVLLIAAFHQRFNDLYHEDQLNAIFAHGVLIWLVHMVHVVFVRGDASYIAGSSTQSGKLPKGAWTSISAPGLGSYRRAYKMLYNFRGIGTSWQVVKTPHLASGDEAADRIHLRRWFLLRQIFTVFCRYIALALFYEISEFSIFAGPVRG